MSEHPYRRILRTEYLGCFHQHRVYTALGRLLTAYPDTPKRSLHPFTPIAPSAN